MNRVKKAAMVTVAVVAGVVAYQIGDSTGVLKGGMGQVFAGEAAAKKIHVGKPGYKAKSGEAWKEKGRIVGGAWFCPGCKVEALDAEGKEVVKSATLAATDKCASFELEWLSPGTYQFRVSADGFDPVVVPGLVVKVGNDLNIPVYFPRPAKH